MCGQHCVCSLVYMCEAAAVAAVLVVASTRQQGFSSSSDADCKLWRKSCQSMLCLDDAGKPSPMAGVGLTCWLCCDNASDMHGSILAAAMWLSPLQIVLHLYFCRLVQARSVLASHVVLCGLLCA